MNGDKWIQTMKSRNVVVAILHYRHFKIRKLGSIFDWIARFLWWKICLRWKVRRITFHHKLSNNTKFETNFSDRKTFQFINISGRQVWLFHNLNLLPTIFNEIAARSSYLLFKPVSHNIGKTHELTLSTYQLWFFYVEQ